MDLTTGEILVEFGSDLLIFGLEGVVFDSVVAAPSLALIDPSGLGTINDRVGIGVLSLSGLPQGLFSLGAIIPEGSRTEEALANLVFRFDGPGNNDPVNAVNAVDNITFIPVSAPGPAIIPEPGSLTLLALACVTAVARRRR